MRIVLHIGHHKTGTTAIQSSFVSLSTDNFEYAKLGNENHSILLYSAFSNNRQDYHIFANRCVTASEISRISSFNRRVIEDYLHSAPDKTIIFSGEDMCALSLAELEELRAFLQAYAKDISVYCYIREPREYARSTFTQNVLDGNSTILSINFQDRFEKFMHVFQPENVHFRKYDVKQFRAGSVVCDFADWLGIDKEISSTTANISPSALSVAWISHLDAMFSSTRGNETLYVLRSTITKAFSDILTQKKTLPLHHFEHHLIAADTAWLCERTGISFDASNDDPLEETPGSSPRAASAVLMDYLSQIRAESLPQVVDSFSKIGVEFDEFPNDTDVVTRVFDHFLNKAFKNHSIERHIYSNYWRNDIGQNATIAIRKYGLTTRMTDGSLFDNLFYLLAHPDVLSAGVDPYLHYCQFGRKENRDWRSARSESD